VREAACIALVVRVDAKDGISLEMGLVGAKTGGKHQVSQEGFLFIIIAFFFFHAFFLTQN